MTSSQVGGMVQTSLQRVRVSAEINRAQVGFVPQMGAGAVVGVVLAAAWIPDTQVVVEIIRDRVERS